MLKRNVVVRAEEPRDVANVRAINLAAFEQVTEADLVDTLRSECDDALSLVADVNGETVGHILFTPATIETPRDIVVGMGLAPMAVLPDHQRQGVGSLLVREGLEILRQKRCPFVILVGHPEYYPRFGFRPASEVGLSCQWEGVPDEAFMALIMDEEAMQGVSGTVRYRPEFDAAV